MVFFILLQITFIFLCFSIVQFINLVIKYSFYILETNNLTLRIKKIPFQFRKVLKITMECVHFQNYLAEFNLDSYKLVSAYFSASVNKEARKRKAFSCLCYTCGKTSTIGKLKTIPIIHISRE